MTREFKIGDPVMLMFGPPSAQVGVTPELKEMEERIFYIKKIKSMYNTAMYELEGCNSKAGVPFSICKDWIVPYHEVRRR